MIDTQAIRQRWDADGSKRDERGRRLFAASEVRAAQLRDQALQAIAPLGERAQHLRELANFIIVRSS